jgi:HD-like signal output (HDOD) protein
MTRILFVDDEPNVLEGLKGMLRRHRREWEMVFACGGAAGIAELRKGPFDVVVSDMRMPGIDGASLLKTVQDMHPHAVRIVLSGQTDEDASRRVVNVAHQFMAKPCDPVVLQQVIGRACKLQALLAHPVLREAVGRVGQLPVKPRTYSRLIAVLENPRSSTRDAAAVVSEDIATSAKILQVVNSAFFGLPRRVSDLESAVAYLGLEVVKALALSLELGATLVSSPPCPGLTMERVQTHALLSARLVRRLLAGRPSAQDAFAAAMFHNVGLLILMDRLSDALRDALTKARSGARTLAEAEVEALGVTHGEIGAYLLGIWGLPYPIVDAAAFHQSPGKGGPAPFDLTGAVHVASALAGELCPGAAGDVSPGAPLDMEYLAAVGMAERVPEWRALAAEVAASARA